jgi:hypothetical protein
VLEGWRSSQKQWERSYIYLAAQIFGCVDWAPSDLLVTFLLAGAAQTCRRRAKVEAILAAGGVADMAHLNRRSPPRDGARLRFACCMLLI